MNNTSIYNTKIKSHIKENCYGPSGTNLSTNIPQVVINNIIKSTNFLHSNTILKERIYCIDNDIGEPIVCKYENCNNTTKFHRTKYRKYCSLICTGKSDLVKKNRVSTYIKNYGYENPNQVKNIQEKKRNTNIRKYGVEFISQRNIDPNTLAFLDSQFYLIVGANRNGKTIKELQDIFEVKKKVITSRFHKLNIPIQFNKYGYEQSTVFDYVQSLIPDAEVLSNDRVAIKPYELDIYVKSLNLAIEYHGSYWHTQPHSEEKHKRKRKLCKEADVKLLEVWDYQWKDSNKETKEKIQELLVHES